MDFAILFDEIQLTVDEDSIENSHPEKLKSLGRVFPIKFDNIF